jgi:AcrR family transcriptional regulator
MDQERRRGRRRDARIDGAVVEATIAEITEKGLGNTTMEGIAVRAGVGKATIYRRWPNKEELFYFLASQLSDVYESTDTGDLRKDLMSVYEPLVEQMRQDGPVALLMPTFIAEAARDPRIRDLVSRLVADRRAGAIHALKNAKRRGELRRGTDLDAAVDMIGGAFGHRSLVLGERLTVSFIRKVIDQTLKGIAER